MLHFRKKLFFISAVLFCVCVFFAYDVFAKDEDYSASKYSWQIPGDVVLGNPDAKITIINYSSLSCPSCAMFHEQVLPEIKRKYIDTGKVKLIFRDYPVYPMDIKASMLVRCVKPDADRYYQFIDALFETQRNWSRETYDSEANLKMIGKVAGIAANKINECLNDAKVEGDILESRQIAQEKFGINGTPTLLINGKIIHGAPGKKKTLSIISEILAE